MKSTAIWKKTSSLAGGRRKKRGKQDRSQVSLGIVSRRKKYKEVSDNSMDSTIANVNGRLEKLAADTEPTIVYSSEREVAATHHLGKVLGIHRDTNDGLVAEHIRRQIDMKYIEGMVGLPLSSCSGAQVMSFILILSRCYHRITEI
ncbi:hypothetical protein Peur_071693 [Populus x canadensis]